MAALDVGSQLLQRDAHHAPDVLGARVLALVGPEQLADVHAGVADVEAQRAVEQRMVAAALLPEGVGGNGSTEPSSACA